MNKKLILLAAPGLGGCAMTTGSTLAQLQASTWQLQGRAAIPSPAGCRRQGGGQGRLQPPLAASQSR